MFVPHTWIFKKYNFDYLRKRERGPAFTFQNSRLRLRQQLKDWPEIGRLQNTSLWRNLKTN